MKTSMSNSQICDLLIRQLNGLFPLDDSEKNAIDVFIPETIARCENSFSKVRNKYYCDSDEAKFDPLHGCQWAFFLYSISRLMHLAGKSSICDKIYALGRALSGADLYYDVELPEIFTFDHPLGAIMGRAHYSNYFSFGQGCTVGNNHGIYPSFGESVFMLSDSKVIGNTTVGDNVIISANAFIKDEVIPSGSIVFGQSPNLIVKEGKLDYVREYAESVFVYD